MSRTLPLFRFRDLDVYINNSRVELNAESDANSMRHYRDMFSSNPLEGMRGLEQLSDQGSVASMTYIGWAHSVGKGVAKDESKAKYWFTRAAGTGSATAISYLALQAFRNRNFGDAFRLYEDAAQQILLPRCTL